MGDLPYDEEYLNKVFEQKPDLKEKINKIVNKLQGIDPNISKRDLRSLKKAELEELIKSVLEAFATVEGDIPKLGELSPEQQILFFKHIEEISKVISEGIFEDDKSLLSLIVDTIAETYMVTLENTSEEPDFLTAKDKKRIKEELKRIMEYEIHKKLNPKQLAGETARDNFLNNMEVGGTSLASQYTGKEYLDEITPSEKKELQLENEKFKYNFNVEKTSYGQRLTPNVSQNNRSGKDFGKE